VVTVKMAARQAGGAVLAAALALLSPSLAVGCAGGSDAPTTAAGYVATIELDGVFGAGRISAQVLGCA
jgi:hypothetical protein